MEDWNTKRVDKYIVINQKLGRGTYGVVYRGYLEENEEQVVAVKQINIKEICSSNQRLQYIKREIDNLQKIDSKYVVKLEGVSRTQTNLYMFLEYCVDGDLKSYVKKKENKILSEPEAIKFFKHIVEGFKELKKHKIIHRDIKPANILLNNGVLKLADFGFSKVIEDEEARVRSFLGSPLYMSPQILDQKPFSSKCDVWSVGIVFYEILYGKTPWSGDSQLNLFQNICNQPLQFPDEPIRSKKVKELIKKMLQLNEKDRISWSDIFQDDLVCETRNQMAESMRKRDLVSDSLEKSILQNEAYIHKNLVIDYLANIDEENEDIKDGKVKILKQGKETADFDESCQDGRTESFEEFHSDMMEDVLNEGNIQVKQLNFKSNTNRQSFSNNSTKEVFMDSNSSEIKMYSTKSDDQKQQNRSSFSQNQQNNFVFTETKEESYAFDEKVKMLIKQQIEAEKMRKSMLKVNDYVLFERNVSFFYNFVIQKLIFSFNEKILKISQDLHYRTIFIISKFQNINLNRINNMLYLSQTDFNQQIWDAYQNSLEYLKTQSILVEDVWFAKRLFTELLKKTTQAVEDIQKKENDQQTQVAITMQNYKKQLNQILEQDASFKQVYQKTLYEIINVVKSQAINTEKKDILIIIKYLIICQNPYSVFNSSGFDFNKFYEQLENMQVQQLRNELQVETQQSP